MGLRFGTIGPPSRPLGGWRLSHVPEKSILPLGRRGGGASRSGLPCGVRGVSCRTKEGHCAFRLVEIAAAQAHTRAKRKRDSALAVIGKRRIYLFSSTNRCARRLLTLSAV